MNAGTGARLLQLSSQALPIGGYSHSQGLESAIEAGAVVDEAGVARWIADVLEFSMFSFELPMLLRMHAAWLHRDAERGVTARALLQDLNDELLCARESAELRAASVQMGYSMTALLAALPEFPRDVLAALETLEEPCVTCAWSAAAAAWGVGGWESALGYGWSWMENQVLVAVKTVPLGQSAGQRILRSAADRLAQWIETARADVAGPPAPVSNFSPGLAILSSHHETQYSRLFRS